LIDWLIHTFLGTTAAHPEKAWRLIHAFPGWTNLIVWFLRQLTWPQILAAVTGPICFLKNVINVVQFWKASKIVSLGFEMKRLAIEVDADKLIGILVVRYRSWSDSTCTSALSLVRRGSRATRGAEG
jgi:hypothetical protein